MTEHLNIESPAIHKHLELLQGVIARMAQNSASCKTWCITLVSAILVVVATATKPNHAGIAAIPITLFFFLDGYYLGLEYLFRGSYNDFVNRMHRGSIDVEDLFIISPGPVATIIETTIRKMFSVSVWPFYIMLYAMLIIAWLIIL